MPPLTFLCPMCNHRMGVNAELAGKAVRCPHCRQVTTAPVAPPAPPEPLPPPPVQPPPLPVPVPVPVPAPVPVPVLDAYQQMAERAQQREAVDSIFADPSSVHEDDEDALMADHRPTPMRLPNTHVQPPTTPAIPAGLIPTQVPAEFTNPPAALVPVPVSYPVPTPVPVPVPVSYLAPVPMPMPMPMPTPVVAPQPYPGTVEPSATGNPFAGFSAPVPLPVPTPAAPSAPSTDSTQAFVPTPLPQPEPMPEPALPRRGSARKPAPAGTPKNWLLIGVSVYAVLATVLAVWGWMRSPDPAAVPSKKKATNSVAPRNG